jgi:hypothetical protein
MDYPFDTVGLDSETIDSLHETYKALKSKFHIEFTGDIDFRLEDFEVFRLFFNTTLRDSYVIKNTNNYSYILFIETHLRSAGSKTRVYDVCQYHTWALAYLKRDFGRVMIRKETLADKIVELIHPIELDFEEDKAFSDTFYVLVNDRHKAASAMDRNFRNAVMDIRQNDFIIEMVNHTLIIGNTKPISPENAIHLAEFVLRICSSC